MPLLSGHRIHWLRLSNPQFVHRWGKHPTFTPKLRLMSVDKNYRAVFRVEGFYSVGMFGHSAINPLQIGQIRELDPDSTALAGHRDMHIGREELCQKVLEFQ